VAARKATGHTRGHKLDSSQDAAVATNPTLNAMMAEILKMLPKPCELVCLLCLSFIYFTYFIFSLAQNEMLLLYDCQDFWGVYGLRVPRPQPWMWGLFRRWRYLVLF
jgi:hypothetical protein